ncbi:MAG: short-chain dehydrogenase [Chloroflexi bacterium RBG_19FT_COMBO_55_16]|nr:MAG: short-chain dehydrogenase [Chloroflexi bacterium RBG_19FT_COMBO_55_16]
MTMNNRLMGRVCLVTGATAGIGAVTARELARMGATVVGVGRNPDKCATVGERVKSETGNPQVEFLSADLSSQAQVRRLAEAFKQKYDRLEVLVNNAGAYYLTRQDCVDGIELTFALNHLGYFLLTNLLLDLIKASAPARIVNVSSNAHQSARMDFASLKGGGFYNSWAAYSQSKLANLLFTYELARRLEGTGVTVNALHPGFVASSFAHNNGWLVAWGTKVAQKLAGRTPEDGARTVIYLATSPEVEGISGKYFIDEKVVDSSPVSYDETSAKRLWVVSEQMTGLRTVV